VWIRAEGSGDTPDGTWVYAEQFSEFVVDGDETEKEVESIEVRIVVNDLNFKRVEVLTSLGLT
jgi:hypothetical protein